MLPVALKLGDGGEMRAPLGAVLVGGMATSTLLSLLYVPVAYTYFDSLSKLGGKVFHWRPWSLRASGQAWRRGAEPKRGTPYAVAGGAGAVGERLQALRGGRRRRAQRPALAVGQ